MHVGQQDCAATASNIAQDSICNSRSATATKTRRFCCNLYGNFIEIIGLKVPGNYSAAFWSNNFSILLLERPKPNISMISVVGTRC